jgi:hypothetical protein
MSIRCPPIRTLSRWWTYLVKLWKLLLNAQIHIAVLVKTLLHYLSTVLAAFADGLHFELHLRHGQQLCVGS